MGLEESARRRVEANQERERATALLSEPARVQDVPQLEEFIALLRKYEVRPIGLYRELKNGHTLLGLGTSYTRYGLQSRGWILHSSHGSGFDHRHIVHLIITEDGVLYRGAHFFLGIGRPAEGWTIKGVDRADTFSDGFSNGLAVELQEEARLTLANAELYNSFGSLFERVVAEVLKGHRSGSILLRH